MSKAFVFIVGKQTDNLRKGSCQYCRNHFSVLGTAICYHRYTVDTRSYIEYEYQKAIRDGLRIIVLYNYATIQKDKCPELLRNMGIHLPAYYYAQDGKCYWNYQKIKAAINNAA